MARQLTEKKSFFHKTNFFCIPHFFSVFLHTWSVYRKNMCWIFEKYLSVSFDLSKNRAMRLTQDITYSQNLDLSIFEISRPKGS